MASLTDIPALRSVMAPTRAAAHRRRQLRKIASAICVGLAVFIVFGSSRASTQTPASTQPPAVNLAGLHVISITADPGITSVAKPGTHVDLWGGDGAPIAKDAPVTKSSTSSGGLTGSSSSSILVGLTDVQMKAYAQVRTRNNQDMNAILVTLSPK